VVGEHIQKIAARFYERLFTAHPSLLDGTFNRGNQHDGSQQQALAGSVAAFATGLVTSDSAPEKLMSRIAHKHASLGIKPEQYQVVHDELMGAIVDILGDAVTPEVAAAWDEVYWLMANALINQERGLYSARGVKPQTVWRDWAVEKKIPESPDVMTFVFKRIDDRLVKTSLPGQYVTVQMPMPDGVRQPRQFSLTRADDGQHRQISIKRVRGAGKPDGEVSTLMCDTLQVGDVVTMSLMAMSCLTIRGARSCSPAPASASPRWPACCHIWPPPAPACRSWCCTPTSTRAPLRCAGRLSATSSRCPTRRCTSGMRTAPPATNRSTGCMPG
jgi:nitric oxide dioxygenase